jgi:hypothetical protein
MVMTLLFSFTGRAAETEVDSEGDLLERIVAVNEKLQDEDGAYGLELYDADGTLRYYEWGTSDEYLYGVPDGEDGPCLYYFPDFYMAGMGIFDFGTEKESRIMYMNCTGEPLMTRESGISLILNERLISAVEKDGELIVVTRNDQDSEKDGNSGWTISGQKVEAAYRLDPDTLLLQGFSSSTIEEDGTLTPNGSSRYFYDENDACIRDVLETGRTSYEEALSTEEGSRTLTVIVDPGTEYEETYSETFTAGQPVSPILPDGYELYVDAACTEPFVSDGTMGDLKIFAGPAKTVTESESENKTETEAETEIDA